VFYQAPADAAWDDWTGLWAKSHLEVLAQTSGSRPNRPSAPDRHDHSSPYRRGYRNRWHLRRPLYGLWSAHGPSGKQTDDAIAQS